MYTEAYIQAMLADPASPEQLVTALRELYHWQAMGLPAQKEMHGQMTPFGMAASILEAYAVKEVPTSTTLS